MAEKRPLDNNAEEMSPGEALSEPCGRRMWEVVCTFPFRLIGANLLCMLFCLPVITIPAALCGLNAVIQNFYRKKHDGVIELFWREVRTAFISRTLVSAVAVLPAAVGVMIAGYSGSVISVMVCAVLITATLIVSGWLFPQLALLEIKPIHALKNSVLLLMIESKKNFCLMLVQLVPLTLLLLFWPMSLFAAALIIPVVPAILVSVIVLPVLEERIICKPRDHKS